MQEVEELFSKLENAIEELRLNLEKSELSTHEVSHLLRKALALLEIPSHKRVNPLEVSFALDLAEKEREIFADLITDFGGQLAEIFQEYSGTKEVCEKALKIFKRTALWLQPPDDFIRMGLTEGIKYFVKKAFEGTPMEIELQLENLPEKLPYLLALFIFRIFQGALLYAYQYAKAHKIEVVSSKEGKLLSLRLSHSGLPFDEKDPKMLGALIPLYARVHALGGEMKIIGNTLSFHIPFTP